MIEFENEIEIEQPINTVFEFLADLENLPKWNYFVTQVRKTASGPPRVGATYHQVRKSDSQELKIIEFEEHRVLTVETIPPSKPALWRRMTFENIGGKTRIRDSWKLDTGHPGILQTFGKVRVKSAVMENLTKLKELLETGQITLQDGRTETL
ncbi:MAG: SRPBCC family protein [Candidatus Thorarchaeota archaeon]